MRTIYIDSENKCHVFNDGKMVAVTVDHFDGKCDFFVEGHCCIVDENSIIIWPWKDFDELIAAQRKYEQRIINEHNQVLQELGVEV